MKTFLLAALVLMLVSLAAFGQPVQRNFYTSTNYTGNDAASARAYLGVGIGGATNGIQQLNGFGTNTTLTNPTFAGTITGLPNFQTNFVHVTTAIGNGVADDTAAIQANIIAVEAAGGGILAFPAGTFKVTSTIIVNTSNTVIQGQGEGTVFQAVGDYGDVFYARPDVDPTTPGTFVGIQFLNFCINGPTNNRTSGAAIHTKWTHNALVRDVRIGSMPFNYTNALPFYDGINMENEGNFIIANCQIYMRAHGVTISAHKLPGSDGALGVGGNYYDGLITDNCNIWGDPLYREGTNCIAIFVNGGSTATNSNGGLQIEQTAVFGCVNGVRTHGANRELFIGHAFAADSCGGAGIYIESNSVQRLLITGGWGAGNGLSASFGRRDGIYVQDDTNQLWNPQISIVGGTYYANGGNGIYLGSGSAIIMGVTCYSNALVDFVFTTNYVGGGGVQQIAGSRYQSATFIDSAYLGLNWPKILIGNSGPDELFDAGDIGTFAVYSMTNLTKIHAGTGLFPTLGAGTAVVTNTLTLPATGAAVGKVPTSTGTDGNWSWQASGAGTQTPWAQNINGGAFSLTNATLGATNNHLATNYLGIVYVSVGVNTSALFVTNDANVVGNIIAVGNIRGSTATLNGSNPGVTNVPTWGDVTNIVNTLTLPSTNFLAATNGAGTNLLITNMTVAGYMRPVLATAVFASSTNYVVDFNLSDYENATLTADVNFQQSTNRSSTLGGKKVLTLYPNGTNRTVTLSAGGAASWHTNGFYSTSFTLTNNTYATVTFYCNGSTETNVFSKYQIWP